MTPEGTAKDDVLVPEGELGVMLTDEFGKGTDLCKHEPTVTD